MTNDYQLIEIPSDFRFLVDLSYEASSLSAAVQARVESIWQRESQCNPHLFNGRLLSLLAYDAQCLTGVFVDYKYYLAQLREPELADVLGIEPVCVSALTRTESAVLIGKRSPTVVQYPAYYELVPSGGLDADSMKGKDEIDIGALALRELVEEGGIDSRMVVSLHPKALVKDAKDKSLEIFVEIVLADEAAHIACQPASHEHTELRWVDKYSLAAFVQQHKEEWQPLSLLLIDRYFS